MELKYSVGRGDLPPWRGSNRTFMELKLFGCNQRYASQRSSNRTFMELKFGKRLSAWVRVHVLIVPLWN